MNATRTMQSMVSLNRALLLCGISKKAWHYTPKPRNVSPGHRVRGMVQKIGLARSTYGAWPPKYPGN